MTSNVDTQVHKFARRFGNASLNWTIYRYPLIVFKEEDFSITSPKFKSRGSQITTWQLILRPAVEDNGRRQFVFRLNRLDDKPGTTVVGADWKITLMATEESLICTKAGYTFIPGNSWYESAVFDDAADIFQILSTFKSDRLIVKFQVIVSHREANNRFEVNPDAGLRALSRDLFALYKRCTCYDVIIRLRDKSIRAHKAILQCRSSYFKLIFEQHPSREFLDLREFSYETVNNMLSYLYAGKLEFVLGRPSIEMYDCAVLFQIEELKQHYALDYWEILSRNRWREMCQHWHISDYTTRDEDMIESKNFIVSNVTARLRLFLNDRYDASNSVRGFVKILCNPEKQYIVRLKLGIMNSNKELVCISKNDLLVQNNSLSNICEWNKEVVSSNVSANGVLKIKIWFQVCASNTPWAYFRTHTFLSSSNLKKPEHSYISLSNDIRSLFTSGSFSDYTFVFKNEDFKVHRCILAERLYSYLKKLRKSIDDVYPKAYNCHIGNIFWGYLYGGILNTCRAGDAIELYGVADEYLLPILKVISSRFLQSSLTVENVTDILIFADKEQDKELKKSALNLISHNFQDLSAEENFQRLETTHLPLYREICKFENKDDTGITP